MPVPAGTSCMTMGKSFNYSEPLLHMYLVWFLWELNGIVLVICEHLLSADCVLDTALSIAYGVFFQYVLTCNSLGAICIFADEEWRHRHSVTCQVSTAGGGQKRECTPQTGSRVHGHTEYDGFSGPHYILRIALSATCK